MSYQCDITIHNLPEDEEKYEEQLLAIEKLLEDHGYTVTIGLGEAE